LDVRSKPHLYVAGYLARIRFIIRERFDLSFQDFCRRVTVAELPLRIDRFEKWFGNQTDLMAAVNNVPSLQQRPQVCATYPFGGGLISPASKPNRYALA